MDIANVLRDEITEKKDRNLLIRAGLVDENFFEFEPDDETAKESSLNILEALDRLE